MNPLKPSVTDALTELINMAFGVSAAKLSDISGCRVIVDVPAIGILPMSALAAELRTFVKGRAVSVHQAFRGPISGDAILLLDYEGAVKVSDLASDSIDEGVSTQILDSSAGEVLTEAGNMLLSACLGTFGNLLEVHITFSVPELRLDSLEAFLGSLTEGDELQYAIVITTSFTVFDQGIEARFVIILGTSSLDRLIQGVERWEGSQDTAEVSTTR